MNTLRSNLRHWTVGCLGALARALTLPLPRCARLGGALGILATLAFGRLSARAEVVEAWVHRYSTGVSNSRDRALKVARDAAGDIIVTGTTYGSVTTLQDLLTIKYSGADGSVIWQKRYNGPANQDEGPSAVAVDSSGNVIVTGYSQGRGGAYDSDYYTAKYSGSDGILLWEQRYGGLNEDRSQALAVDGSGNVVVTGYSQDQSNTTYTAKYAAADGTLLWGKRSSGPWYSAEGPTKVAVDDQGNVLVMAPADNGINRYHDTAKLAATDGALLWKKRSPGLGKAVAVDGAGNVVAAGASGIVKYSADGTEFWTNVFAAVALAVDGRNDVVVIGSTNNGIASAKYAALDGALLWEHHSVGSGQAVAVDGGGNVVVTGTSKNGREEDYYTAKYAAADGALLWEKRFNGPAGGDDFVNTSCSLALGPGGMVAVAGSSQGDFATVVYREVLPAVSIDLLPSGVRLRFTGESGQSYKIERAPAVTGPWTTLATPTVPVGGLLVYVDANPQVSTAFYRTVRP